MKKSSDRRSSNLSFLFEEEGSETADYNPWTPEHLEANRQFWDKLKRPSAMYDYNLKWYGNVLKEDSDEHVKFLAGAKLKWLSDWAKVEGQLRKIL